MAVMDTDYSETIYDIREVLSVTALRCNVS
jgi:hypothetical protein